MDKFYTKPEIVDLCLEKVDKFYDWREWDLVVEPSAGNGNFYLKLPVENKVGLDIAPEDESIIEMNFFDYTPDNVNQTILVIGNPPFGRVSSMAIKFFNHAAKWANVIAFIIPRTFRRVSVQNRLDLHFHLKYDMEIPLSPCSFEPPMMAKCCFQIWEKSDQLRNVTELTTVHADWNFLQMGPKDANNQPAPPIGADFAIRAYGGKCGEIRDTELETLRPKSWHWIKSNIDVEVLKQRFKNLDYSVSLDTARQNSIGRAELVSLYEDSI
jgi:hypothetical protein